jgi:hypothetical protein
VETSRNEEIFMSAMNPSEAQATFGISQGYQVIQRGAFEAASRVLRYHATAAELRLARRQAALEQAERDAPATAGARTALA